MAESKFKYRGGVERWHPSKRRYAWRAGYSEDGSRGGVLYPWMTFSECIAQAKMEGKKAVFVKEASDGCT